MGRWNRERVKRDERAGGTFLLDHTSMPDRNAHSRYGGLNDAVVERKAQIGGFQIRFSS